MYSGAPRSAFAWSSTSTTSAAVMERPSCRPTLSRVCSSHMARALIGRPSAVESNMKSSAQTWFRRSARSRFAGTVLVPTRCRFIAYGLTLRPVDDGPGQRICPSL